MTTQPHNRTKTETQARPMVTYGPYRKPAPQANAALIAALRELLEYTGGSDLVETKPEHPIAKAFKALAKAEGRE